jgi:hypothetical protein
VLSGFIENFMDVKPKGLIRLVGHLGDSIKQTVTIVPSDKYPFQITEIKADNGQNIKFEMSGPEPDQNRYILTIENTKTTQGRYFDSLVLKTTNTLKPEFSMRIFGDIRPPKNPEVKPDVKKDTN